MANLQNVIDTLTLAISLMHYHNHEESHAIGTVIDTLKDKQARLSEEEVETLKNSFDIKYNVFRKIPVIKAIRARTGRGLKESKDMVDTYIAANLNHLTSKGMCERCGRI